MRMKRPARFVSNRDGLIQSARPIPAAPARGAVAWSQGSRVVECAQWRDVVEVLLEHGMAFASRFPGRCPATPVGASAEALVSLSVVVVDSEAGTPREVLR